MRGLIDGLHEICTLLIRLSQLTLQPLTRPGEILIRLGLLYFFADTHDVQPLRCRRICLPSAWMG